MEMPKTYFEQLDEIKKGGYLQITEENRHLWQNEVSRWHKSVKYKKQLTIRRNKETGDICIWRLK